MNKKLSKKQKTSAHYSFYVAIVIIVALVAIVLLIMNYNRLSKDQESLVGAARLQVQQVQPKITPQQAVADTAVASLPYIQALKAKMQTQKAFECPSELYLSKSVSRWETPEYFEGMYLVDYTTADIVASSLSLEKVFCHPNGMRCDYSAPTLTEGVKHIYRIGLPIEKVRDCTELPSNGPSGCTCFTFE